MRASLAVSVLLLGLAAGAASAQRPKARLLDLSQAESLLEDARLQAVFQQWFAELSTLDPEAATKIGSHERDYQLSSLDDATYRKVKGLASKYVRKLQSEIDPKRLSGRAQLRYKFLLKEFEAKAHDFDRVDWRRISPQAYLRADAIRSMLVSDAHAYSDRVRYALERLDAVPRLVAQGKTNLTRAPRPWLEAALKQADGAIAWVPDLQALMKPFLDINPEEKARVDAAVKGFKDAAADWKAHLEKSLAASDGRFPVGGETFDLYLRSRHFFKGDSDAFLRAAKEGVRLGRKRLEKLTRALDRRTFWQRLFGGGPEVPAWQVELEKLRGDAPKADELLAAYKREADAAFTYLERQGLVELPKAPLQFVATPAYERPLVFAAEYRGPAPLDRSSSGEVWVSVPAGPEAPRLLAAAHSLQGIRLAVARHAWPGEHTAALAAKAATGLIERSALSSSFFGGWELYSGALAAESGYMSSPAAQLYELHAELAAAAKAAVDVQLHTGVMSQADAKRYLVDEARMTPEEAEAAVLSLSMEPGEAAGAWVGFDALRSTRSRLQKKLKDRFSLREFHRRALSFGSLPPALYAGELYDEWVKRKE